MRRILGFGSVGVAIIVLSVLIGTGLINMSEYYTLVAAGLTITILGVGYWTLKPEIDDAISKRRRPGLNRPKKPKEAKTEPIFEAEILDKKFAYIRGKDGVSFRARYEGSITNGFFANRITVIIPDGAKSKVGYTFPPSTPNVSSDRETVTSWEGQTLDHWSDKSRGTLDGNVKTDWHEWSWDIPEYAPIGNYRVEMSVWNTFSDNKQPYKTITDTLKVIDPDDSHYEPNVPIV